MTNSLVTSKVLIHSFPDQNCGIAAKLVLDGDEVVDVIEARQIFVHINTLGELLKVEDKPATAETINIIKSDAWQIWPDELEELTNSWSV